MKEEGREREEQASERRERSACLKRTPEARPTDLTENITPHERKRHSFPASRALRGIASRQPMQLAPRIACRSLPCCSSFARMNEFEVRSLLSCFDR